jgi:hypothetical protein
LLVLLVLAAIAGATYQALGNRADERRFPPPGMSSKDFADEFHAIWVNDLQVREARLSTRGERIIVDSTHMMPFERPDAIIAAVRQVCAAVNIGKSGETVSSGVHSKKVMSHAALRSVLRSQKS